MSSASPPLRLRIIAINDVYHLDHLPRFRSLVEHWRAVDPADALLVTMAGDFVAPSLLSSLDAGRGMIACLNACGVTHVSLGNHEDDIPPTELRARMSELAGVWLNTNMPSFGGQTKPFDVVTVRRGEASVRVGLLGILMDEPSAYLGVPFEAATIIEPETMALAEAQRLRAEEGCAVVIPLTHQSIEADRALAARRQDVPFPVILGGHDHAVFQEKIDETWVIKAGAEAACAFVVDVTFPAEGDRSRPTTEVRLETVAAYPEDAAVRALVDQHMEQVKQLHRATLRLIPAGEALSSKGTRSRQTTMGTFLCDTLRDALVADVCIFNGGGIRGSKDYAERFTYGDLITEMPFDNEVVVATITGRALAAAIAYSRKNAPAEAGRFLQVDSGLVVGPDHVLTAVRGEPLDADRVYRVATVRELFFGMDHIEPLMEHAAAHPGCVPAVGSGREGKIVLIEAFARSLWKNLGGFGSVDVDGDGCVSEADLQAALERVTGQASPITARLIFDLLDANKDRHITAEESSPGSWHRA